MLIDIMNGVLIINKPSGISSNKVGQEIKRIFSVEKAGHLGTLDPLATGVLPLFINEATKLVHFLSFQQKEYIAEMRLGIETETQDIQGNIISQTDNVKFEKRRIKEVFDEFTGDIYQTPPMYSAIKHKGIPLYKFARKGLNLPRSSRAVTIFDIDILSIRIPYVLFRVVCSSGTYIRTLCSDIGSRLCCGAHLTRLERIRNGNFHISSSITIEDCIKNGKSSIEESHLLSPCEVLTGMSEVRVDEPFYIWIRNGNFIKASDIEGFNVPDLKAGQLIKIVVKGKLGAVAQVLIEKDKVENPYDRVWKTVKIFNLR